LALAKSRSYFTSDTESSVGAPAAGATSLRTETRLLSFTFSSPASFVRTQSTKAFAAAGFLPPLTMLMAPISYPVSFGTMSSTPGFCAFLVRMSCAQFGQPMN
jgi:hypothetical protein